MGTVGDPQSMNDPGICGAPASPFTPIRPSLNAAPIALPDRVLSKTHLPALDGVRGLAVIFVVVHHCAFMVPENASWAAGIEQALHAGWIGVDLFFVLSGFLITGILLDSRKSTNYFISFYARRTLRIFPLYYTSLSFILFLAYMSGTAGIGTLVPPHNYWKLYCFYLQNWWPWTPITQTPNIIGHFWSLGVEEQFYLIWPTVVLLLSVRQIAGLSLVLALAALCLRTYICNEIDPFSRALVENTFLRMDTLLLGAFCACALRIPSLLPKLRACLPWVSGLSAFCLTVIGFAFSQFSEPGELMFTAGFSLLAVFFAALILAIATEQSRESLLIRLFSTHALRAFGKYAYGIYVYHVPLLWFVLAVLTSLKISDSSAIHFGFVPFILGASFLVAKLSYELFESRFLNRKRYFEPKYPVET